MHSRIFIFAHATAIALPVAAHAQIDASNVTREQVRQALVQLQSGTENDSFASEPLYLFI